MWEVRGVGGSLLLFHFYLRMITTIWKVYMVLSKCTWCFQSVHGTVKVCMMLSNVRNLQCYFILTDTFF